VAGRQIYSFQVLDPDPECLTFGCVATSLDEAKQKANRAGYTNLILLEARNPVGVELDEVVELELLANPFVGPEWAPFVDILAPAIKVDGVGKFWVLTMAPPPYTFGVHGLPGDTDFIQAMNEADGSLHLELGTVDIVRANDQEKLDFLAFSGWNAPDDHLPLHHRIFEPGWNPRHVLYVALQAVVSVFGVTPHDLFMPGGAAIGPLRSDPRFDSGTWFGPLQLDSPAFALAGVHPALSNVEPDEATKEAVFASWRAAR
jgi:hypothetical protein